MKIMFIGSAKNIHTVRWVNALSDKGHEVYLITNKNHYDGIDGLNPNINVHKLTYGGTIGYYLNTIQIKRIYKKIQPDIVNAHYASGYGVLARVAKLKPLILSVWGSDVYDFPYESKIKMKIIRKNIKFADQIASTSYSMAKQVENIMQKKMSIQITPFGVDTEVFIKNSELKSKEYFIFGTVKTLSEKYGIEYIIKAFKIFLDKIENEIVKKQPILIIYGKGELEEKLKKLCVELKIEDKVFFKGYILNKEVPNAINNMDVFCLGSILDSESFGVAAVEAMACEVPVIATDVSGFKEVILNEKTGYIVERKNENEIADKMYELFKDKKMRLDMGQRGRKRVLELYDWKENVNTMLEIYKKTMMSN
ncbi:glycosyltransferase [Zhenhengia yiwuensis]|uniref:Glycosyltransferase n=1 Tax=Zhenhengia yiwuensis TaxID=2763666 RepID=A0A926EG70_9FIRM|nr:glycosyltransferase [Zhenhengia yiwuensis]MBC8578954.1 glycosyltransferase [Zhenhengia yiwuensis]